jgi:hypothetical protein
MIDLTHIDYNETYLGLDRASANDAFLCLTNIDINNP